MTIPDEAKKLEEAKKLASESGNNFHVKVAREMMQANDWKITVSPYYMDQTQSKAREIDLILERQVTSFNHKVPVRLFIECKYIPPPSCSVFWFAAKTRRLQKGSSAHKGKGYSLILISPQTS